GQVDEVAGSVYVEVVDVHGFAGLGADAGKVFAVQEPGYHRALAHVALAGKNYAGLAVAYEVGFAGRAFDKGGTVKVYSHVTVLFSRSRACRVWAAQGLRRLAARHPGG